MVDADAGVVDAFGAAMDGDLDTPRTMTVLFDTVRRPRTPRSTPAMRQPVRSSVRHNQICTTFGLEAQEGRRRGPGGRRREAAALDAARVAKDFAAADAVRAELQADGWTVETTKDGTTVRR